MDRAIEWQCACGAWISSGYSRHTHVEQVKPQSMDDMIQARRAAEFTGSSPALGDSATYSHYYRTGKEPTRDAPCPK